MNDVLVSYAGGQFGDWLRYFISEHDGFEKFTISRVNSTGKHPTDPDRFDVLINSNSEDHIAYSGGDREVGDGFPKFRYGSLRNISLKRWNNIEEFKSQLVESDLRQVYKPVENSHSIAYWPTNRYQSISEYSKWDWKYYDILRQTDMNVIFVKLDPTCELFETFVNRLLHSKDNVLSEEQIRECANLNYVHNVFPKHERNHEVEIGYLAEYDEEEYNKLCRFLKVKPLDNWKSYAKELERVRI